MVTPIAQPVVQAMFPLLPKLQNFGNQPIASPMPGPGDDLPFELACHIIELLHQKGSVFDNLALRRSMGFDLRPPGSTGKVDIGFVGFQRFHGTFDSHLA